MQQSIQFRPNSLESVNRYLALIRLKYGNDDHMNFKTGDSLYLQMLFNRVLLPTLGRPMMTTWTPSLSLSPRRWSAKWFCISPLSLSTAAVTTSSEQLRHYYHKRTTQTLLPQENSSVATTLREQQVSIKLPNAMQHH